MLTKSTLQKIKTAYVGKKGKGRIVFDPEGVERFNIAHLILTDIRFNPLRYNHDFNFGGQDLKSIHSKARLRFMKLTTYNTGNN
jgi:hypothetical protein